jgi:hypothetical protein
MPLCHRFDALFATTAGFESGDNAAPNAGVRFGSGAAIHADLALSLPGSR